MQKVFTYFRQQTGVSSALFFWGQSTHYSSGVIWNQLRLVVWSLSSLFSTNTWPIKDDRSGVENYPLTQWRKA